MEPKKHEKHMTFEEILQFVNAAASLGITKVRVTGGEPLVRKGVVGFYKTSSINGIRCFHDYQRMSLQGMAGILRKLALTE